LNKARGRKGKVKASAKFERKKKEDGHLSTREGVSVPREGGRSFERILGGGGEKRCFPGKR